MSDDWDFYFARVEDAVSSIFVDLGIHADAPLEKRPWLLWVFVELKSPRPDGLASSEEAATLNRMGEVLDAAVAATCGAQLVGRITGAGRREFYFYACEPGELEAAVRRAMQAFETYRYETGSALQPEWDQYVKLLYPSDSNLERMRNRRLLEALAADGDVHELPRPVDHWLYFADESGRAACRQTLAEIGFAIEDEGFDQPDARQMPFSLVVSRLDSVDKHSINGLTLELARLAREHRGSYDGWGCEAIAGDTA